jgi:hypothetical protein
MKFRIDGLCRATPQIRRRIQMKPISENEARATRWGRCDNKIAEDRYGE